jgi:hypothetical protein
MTNPTFGVSLKLNLPTPQNERAAYVQEISAEEISDRSVVHGRSLRGNRSIPS